MVCSATTLSILVDCDVEVAQRALQIQGGNVEQAFAAVITGMPAGAATAMSRAEQLSKQAVELVGNAAVQQVEKIYQDGAVEEASLVDSKEEASDVASYHMEPTTYDRRDAPDDDAVEPHPSDEGDAQLVEIGAGYKEVHHFASRGPCDVSPRTTFMLKQSVDVNAIIRPHLCNGDELSFELLPDGPVADMRATIATDLGVPVAGVQLICGNHILEDSQYVDQVRTNDDMHIVLTESVDLWRRILEAIRAFGELAHKLLYYDAPRGETLLDGDAVTLLKTRLSELTSSLEQFKLACAELVDAAKLEEFGCWGGGNCCTSVDGNATNRCLWDGDCPDEVLANELSATIDELINDVRAFLCPCDYRRLSHRKGQCVPCSVRAYGPMFVRLELRDGQLALAHV